MYQVFVQIGEDTHVFFTEVVNYVTKETNEGQPVTFVGCYPTNGQQKGKSTLFPLGRVISICEEV